MVLWRWSCTLVLAACASSGAGSSTNGDPTPGGGGSAGTSGASAAAGAGGAGMHPEPAGATAVAAPAMPRAGSPALPNACVTTGTIEASLRPTNLLFLIDRSASLNCNLPPITSSAECEQTPQKAN